MANLRLVLWNMEWMNDLFEAGDGPPKFRPDNANPQHMKNATVKERREHLSSVLNELNPDLVVIVEGPSRREELQQFFDSGDVQGSWFADLQESKGQSQNIGIAIRTDTGKFSNPPLQRFDTNEIKTFDPFLADTDNDDIDENHKFERRPLYVEVSPAVGNPFRILGLHLKSKLITTALEWSSWWEKADANRKKILAQAKHIRTSFLEEYLTNNQTKDISLIVCGDINDGPGLDASEKRLFGSAVEFLMGNVWKPGLCLGNALFDTLTEKQKRELDFEKIYTTSFKDPIFNDVYQREWIDHIMYSQCGQATWVINAKINEELPDGSKIWKKYKFASDHFPVSVEVKV